MPKKLKQAGRYMLGSQTQKKLKNLHFQIRISGIAHISTCFFYYNMLFKSWCVNKYMQPNLPMQASKKNKIN